MLSVFEAVLPRLHNDGLILKEAPEESLCITTLLVQFEKTNLEILVSYDPKCAEKCLPVVIFQLSMNEIIKCLFKKCRGVCFFKHAKTGVYTALHGEFTDYSGTK